MDQKSKFILVQIYSNKLGTQYINFMENFSLISTIFGEKGNKDTDSRRMQSVLNSANFRIL